MIYLVAWTGGYEAPQYQTCTSHGQAKVVAQSWRLDAVDSDSIQILTINTQGQPIILQVEDIG